MRALVLAVPVLVLAAGSFPRGARAQDLFQARQQVALCQLQYGANARAPLAIAAIRSACSELVFQFGPLHEPNHRYDQCLLQYLQNAQSNAAAQQVIGSCRQLVPLF